MPKLKTQFICQDCGANFSRWQGQCTTCGEWNTLLEEQVLPDIPADTKHVVKKQSRAPIPIDQIEVLQEVRLATHIDELDRVLGGGFVTGSVTLLGGEPGIGKSTLSLQTACVLAAAGQSVMIVSGEESSEQIHLRAKRFGDLPKGISVYSEYDMAKIMIELEKNTPDVIILDSIQVVYHPSMSSVAGTVTQVRHSAQLLISFVKDKGLTGILIGHITKDGTLAGPKVLEHLVDVILVLEGERDQRHRILRCFKNRYGSTREVGIFDMTETGLKSVSSLTELFIDGDTLTSPGSVLAAVTEGSRVFLVEVQALVVSTSYGMAKRTFLGVDPHRANLMIAAMEKIMGFKLSSHDIILNIVGGLKVSETALDLAIVLAIVSSLKDTVVGATVGAFGEVGLTGEVRPVSNADSRVLELEKMGLTDVVFPEKNAHSVTSKRVNLKGVRHIRDAISWMLAKNITKTT